MKKTYEKLQKKMNKRIGQKATTKMDPSLLATTGVITSAHLVPTGDAEMPYAINYLIDYGNKQIYSPEQETVIFLL